jgi:lambda family phage portal protein
MSLPLIERLLAPVAPGWAARRLLSRAGLEAAARAYDAARATRATKNWLAGSTSAQEEIRPALATLRNRSRDLCRNNPWGQKIRRQLPAHLVGTGVTPRPSSGAERTRRRALETWAAWSEATDIETGTGFEAQQALLAGTVVESGEALLLWSPDARAPGGWTTRVLEPDYLDEHFNETSRSGGGRIVNGIEFDAAGRRVAYHLWREHPGDYLLGGMPGTDRIRVEARFVDHVFEVLRPGQTRGVPWLAASALRLRGLDDYLESERWRKKVTAAFGVFLLTPNAPAMSTLGAQTTETTADGARRGLETIAPGTIKRLKPGEDVKFSAPPADQGLMEYVRSELLAVAAGCGVPYAEMTGDLSNSNYSSMRAGKIEFYALLDAWQWLMLKPMLLGRAWGRVQAAGGVPGLPASWTFPKRQWVDPLKDAQAEILAIRAGLVSQPDAVAARGENWREVLAEQAEFLAAAREAGLVLETDVAGMRPPPAPADLPDDDEDDMPAEPPADDAQRAAPMVINLAVDARPPAASRVSRTVSVRRDGAGNLVGEIAEAEGSQG